MPETGEGKRHTFRGKKGHGVSKNYTTQQENRSREADIQVSRAILERKLLKSQQ